MSKRRDKRVPQEENEEAHEIIKSISQNTDNFVIKQKFILNPVHETFYNLCLHDKTKMLLVDGPAGSAKTFLAAKAGLTLLKEKKVDQIVYIRSIVESASKSIGALPGEVDEKFKPWSMPLVEKLNELIPTATATRLFEREAIKCIPVNFVRGLTFHNSFVIVDEAQNLTKEELITILTRFGQYSKYVVIGDTFQRDIGSHSGFMHIWHRFNDEESQDVGIHTARFTEHEIVRSPILRFIVRKLT